MKPLVQNSISKRSLVEESDFFANQKEPCKAVAHQFISSCTSSMRSPVKAIKGLVSLLKDSSSNPEINPAMALNFIVQNAERIDNMLNEMDQYVDNAGKMAESRSIEMDDLILEVVMGFQKEIKAHKIDMSVSSEQSSPFFSDPAKIRLILGHLILNAICFQRVGNPHKKISLHASVSDEGCTISVQDNGIGIEAAETENIFKLFNRSTFHSHGAGIGLFVVRDTLEKMNGKIEVESEYGSGSVFTFNIPNLVLKVSKGGEMSAAR